MAARRYNLRAPLAAAALSISLGIAAGARAEEAAADREGIEFFEKKIRPVLVEHCYECHSSKSKAIEGGLSLESKAGWLNGGDRGPAIVPGDPEKSLLIQALRYEDEDFQMPPKQRLPAEVVADFVAWIERGALDPRNEQPAAGAYVVDIDAARQRWPYTLPVAQPIPAVKGDAWPRNPIDHFVLAKLEERGLMPVGDADKRTLLRRITYDLIGLPPTPDEVAEFAADDSPQALAKVIDRLLESPHYGERWGRHWLDVVRYADTAGDNSDYPIPQIYRYRNWVIDAFNADLPYDQFIRQQLAGDLLPADSSEQKHRQTIATGYLANARRFGSRVDDYPQHLTIEDTIDNLGRAFLAHTLNCARCHNHKFDPITTEDYYALYGIFHSTRYPWPGIELDKRQRNFVPLATEEQVAAANAERQAKLEELESAVKALDDEKKAAQNDQDGDAKKKRLSEIEERLKAARRAKDDFERSPLPYDLAYAVAETGKIENCKLHIKGDPLKTGQEVPRRMPQVFGGQLVPPESNGSGRLELADWIASPQNPLTARVMVNRIWHHHFGRGLVATPNDFGKQGQPPMHPELLDWLALRFIESGWSVKEMQRLLLGSRTYQLISARGQETGDRRQEEADPSNYFFWRQNRRRLDAESIRDTLLVLGNNLDVSMGEAHPFPPQKDWDFTQHKPFKAVYDTNRRSVYLMTQRIQRHPLMAIFDGPDTGASTGSRVTSTTTLQALYFLNDPFVHDQAMRFADRLRQAGGSDAQRIALAYEQCFNRPPSDEERSQAEQYLAQLRERFTPAGEKPDDAEAQAWQSLARVLLRTNEWVYVD